MKVPKLFQSEEPVTNQEKLLKIDFTKFCEIQSFIQSIESSIEAEIAILEETTASGGGGNGKYNTESKKSDKLSELLAKRSSLKVQ